MGNNKAIKESPTRIVDKQTIRLFSQRKMAAQRLKVGKVIKTNNATFKPL